VDVAVGKPRSREYDRELRRYLRIVRSKEHVQKFVARLQAVRRKSLLPRFSLPAPTTPMNSMHFSPLGGQSPASQSQPFAPNGAPPPSQQFNFGRSPNQHPPSDKVQAFIDRARQVLATDDDSEELEIPAPETSAPETSAPSPQVGSAPTQPFDPASAANGPMASLGSHASPGAGPLSSANLRYCPRCYTPIRQFSKVCPRCRGPVPGAPPPQRGGNAPSFGQPHEDATQPAVDEALWKARQALADDGDPTVVGAPRCCSGCWQPVPANVQSCPRCGEPLPGSGNRPPPPPQPHPASGQRLPSEAMPMSVSEALRKAREIAHQPPEPDDD
jgi:hypothetical protein